MVEWLHFHSDWNRWRTKNMPYKCSKCGAEITEEFAAKTTEKFGEALCKSCVFDKNTGESKGETEGAPSAPDKEPALQTHNVGDKLDDDVPVVEHPESNIPPTDGDAQFYDYVRNLTGNDVFEVFADSGTCKTKLCLEVTRQALHKGHKVWYIDAEHNLSDDDISSLKGVRYTYEPRLSKIFNLTNPDKLPKDIDMIVLDSIGYPGLAAWARLKANERGNALLQVIAIFDGLKQWALVNNSFAFVTNQPESKFAKPADHIREPWGDKGAFATKEVFTMEYSARKAHITTVIMKAHRSRSMGRGQKIATINVTNDGTEIKMV